MLGTAIAMTAATLGLSRDSECDSRVIWGRSGEYAICNREDKVIIRTRRGNNFEMDGRATGAILRGDYMAVGISKNTHTEVIFISQEQLLGTTTDLEAPGHVLTIGEESARYWVPIDGLAAYKIIDFESGRTQITDIRQL